MDKKLNFKPVKLNKVEFYLRTIKIMTGLEEKYAKGLAIMLKNYPETVVDENMKKEFIEILELQDNKKSYQNQSISNCLTYLTDNGYLKKIQNGIYSLNSELVALRKGIGESNKVSYVFNFEINE